ncbi:hypothetical protein [Qipengyuania sp.]|uniref:hypothetical protein n=1 Tax=Qipengyuania sp. TaxID=2004515 RepID=UPI003BAD6CB5|eukprot:Skav209687  [mRNA]  locus=C9244649:1677:2594:+ [translate_table: standard]
MPFEHLRAEPVQSPSTAEPEPEEESSFADGLFAEVEVGLRYDSEVAVDELDLASRQSDEALRARIRLGYEADIGEDTDARVSYGISQTWYEEFTTFDLQTHTLAASVSHDLGPARAGLSYRYIHARLDRDGLLDVHRVAPSLSGFVSKGVFVRAEALYRDTDFAGRVDRDNEAMGGGFNLYFFMDGNKRYFAAGYDFTDVDAVDDQFDYVGHAFQLRFSQKFPIGSGKGRLRAGWRYQLRDYQAVTPAIGMEREDDRHRLRAELELPITDLLGVSTRYSYYDYESNLPSADYQQHLVDIALRAEF